VCADQKTIDLRSIKRSARRKLDGMREWEKDQAVVDAMVILEQAGWVAVINNELHKRAVTWAINPQIATQFADYRESVIKAKQRHVDYIYRHAYAAGKERKIVKGYTE